MLNTRAMLIGGAAIAALGGCGADAPADPARAQASLQAVCTSCHQLSVIENSMGYSEAGWRALMSAMIELDPATESELVAYLAQVYPPGHNPRPAALV